MSSIVVRCEFTVINCGACGISFAVPEPWRLQKQRDHTGFRCPNGCSRAYVGESDVERIAREKREAENKLQARVNEAEHARLVAEKELDKVKRAKRKIEARVSHGVCPCCDRTFENLAKHMETKHKNVLEGGKTVKQVTAGE